MNYSPEELIAALEELDPMLEAINGIKQKLVVLGWSNEGAEALVLATFQNGGNKEARR